MGTRIHWGGGKLAVKRIGRNTYASPDGIFRMVVLQGAVEMQRLGAFGDKVLCFPIDQRDHGALGVEPPGDELRVCGEHCVRPFAVSNRWTKVFVEFPSSNAIERRVALQRDRRSFLDQHVSWSNEDLYSRVSVVTWPTMTASLRERPMPVLCKREAAGVRSYIARSSPCLQIWAAGLLRSSGGPQDRYIEP